MLFQLGQAMLNRIGNGGLSRTAETSKPEDSRLLRFMSTAAFFRHFGVMPYDICGCCHVNPCTGYMFITIPVVNIAKGTGICTSLEHANARQLAVNGECQVSFTIYDPGRYCRP